MQLMKNKHRRINGERSHIFSPAFFVEFFIGAFENTVLLTICAFAKKIFIHITSIATGKWAKKKVAAHACRATGPDVPVPCSSTYPTSVGSNRPRARAARMTASWEGPLGPAT